MKLMKFFIKVGLIALILFLVVKGFRVSTIKLDAMAKEEHVEKQRIKMVQNEALRSKTYRLVRGGRSVIIRKPYPRSKIRWIQEERGSSCKFRLLDHGSGLPIIIRGVTDVCGWIYVPPGTSISSEDLPNPDEIAAYEFAWWAPRSACRKMNTMLIQIGFNR